MQVLEVIGERVPHHPFLEAIQECHWRMAERLGHDGNSFLRTNEKMELEKKNNSKISKILLKLIVARNSFSSLTNLLRKSKKLDQLISLLWDRFWIFNWFMSKIEWTQQRRGALIFILSDCDWSYIWLWLVWIDFLFIVIDLNWCLLNSIEF